MLTFEELRDYERKEREERKLQKLPENFLTELKALYAQKKKSKDTSPSNAILFENVKRSIMRLFEARERKLIEHALFSARTGIEIENLLEEEKMLFENIKLQIEKFRKKFFDELEKAEPQEKFVATKTGEFIGPDTKTYTLKEGEIVELPQKVVNAFLKTGIIKKLNL